MIKTRSAKFSVVVSLWIVGLICFLSCGGCSESATNATDIDSMLNPSEQEFQEQANRPPTSKTLFAMADILATQGRDAECEFVLKRIIQDNPKYLPAYNSLAELQMRRGYINTAIETIHDAFRINSEDPLLQNNLGVCWIVRGDYDKALEVFTRATGTAPENARYRMNMAVALGLLGRYEESLSLFRQVLPEDQAIHNVSILRQKDKNVVPVSALQESL